MMGKMRDKIIIFDWGGVIESNVVEEYNIYVAISNIILLDKSRLNNQIDLNKFDYVWLSFEIGLTKPDENIYKLVERECKILPNNILFIDDKEENIVCAQKRGWNACHARGMNLVK